MGAKPGPLTARLAKMAMAAVGQTYPHHLQHLMHGEDELRSPKELHPAFHGCFDWHSAVHSHWTLVRLLRGPLDEDTQSSITDVLNRSFSPENLASEAAYLAHPGRVSFERPYGLAWCLALAGELATSPAAHAPAWRSDFEPLATAALANLEPWLTNLTRPVRSGTHQQTAFALGLLLDWAEHTRRDYRDRLHRLTLRLYGADRCGPIDFEPSGEDFLSPCLMEAELVSRALPPDAFAAWLENFLPSIPQDPAVDWLVPASVVDETDGKAVHLHGLNLSRAWNLEHLATALPPTDRRIPVLRACGARHAAAGLAAVRAVSAFASTHWLATFAVFLLTRPTRKHDE